MDEEDRVRENVKFFDRKPKSQYIIRYYKAPTVRELGGWLPDFIDDMFRLVFVTEKIGKRYRCAYSKNLLILEGCDICENTEANARAKMLIWLAEKKYINFKEGEEK